MQKSIPSWDLSDLFSSPEDPKIFELIDDCENKAQKFKEKYHGALAEFVQPEKMIQVIREYEEILNEAAKPQAYAELIFTTRTNDAAIGSLLQKVRSRSVEIFANLLFLDLEISKFSDEQFSKFLQSKELANYHHFLERLRAWKSHRLSEEQEQVMEYKSLTSNQAYARLFEQELSLLKFPIEIGGQKQELNQSQILNLLYTQEKQEDRKLAQQVFSQKLKEKSSVLTFVFNTLAEDKKIEDKLRNFYDPEQARHLANETNKQTVEAMAQAVEENYSLVQEYYDFKKHVLGLDKLYDYDRYAPIAASSKIYEYEQAREIVLDSFLNFNQEFAQIANQFFQKKWIDAAPLNGKRGGAYCSGISPKEHSYVFMNFTGSANDVMTLAHELGHGINFELARAQTYLNYNNPLTIAETASIFSETLTFERLVKMETDTKNLLALYMQKIESIFASVQRQISMFRFEQDFHNAYRKSGELSFEQIGEIWMARQKQMFGNSIELTREYADWWMYIPHFVRSPFYVYAYAFGEMLSLGLLELSKKDGDSFYPKYRQFLEAGGSRKPEELAEIFSIDLNQSDFWRNSMQSISHYLEKAKELYETQKKL